MKSLEPQKIAGFTSLGFLALTLIFFFSNYFSPNLYFSLSISIPIFFGLAFFLVNYFIDSFIYSKIKPIYKTIHSFNPNKPEDTPNSKEDIFSKANKEVASWMEGKTREIKQLRQMEKYRKEYLGDVSHELKTPIFNIQGYILTLLDGGIDDPNINMLYLNRTEKSIDRMISIIEDLEAISKLESGELELHQEDFNLYHLIDDIFELQEIRAKDKNIKLKFGKNIEKTLLVKADKQRIFQVLSNLIVNSINYGKKDGQTTVNAYDMDNRVLIEVKDTGIGIEGKDVPRIFERFFRVDKSRSREQGGTGLGLAIVKHIIEAHKQTINVNSTYGKGTSFTFTLEKTK
ncbi:sensor histidine kinase [Marinilabiliaceae bacterium JC017]|nr:sensor histidine kinase [Marinilabiliaceae bacterium JC017]